MGLGAFAGPGAVRGGRVQREDSSRSSRGATSHSMG
jgi:hypothetical protein